MLMRRCPSRSMTIVGDMAQASELGGGSSWQEVLGPNLADRYRVERLTINYRTPAEIAEVAADVLEAIDPELHAPRPVRETGISPWQAQAPAGELGSLLGELAREESAAIGVPDAVLEELTLDRPVVVLSVKQVRGLEFDSVLVADPARIVAESTSGLNDLYVAITRATQRLGVVHEGDLPSVLSRLSRR